MILFLVTIFTAPLLVPIFFQIWPRSPKSLREITEEEQEY